MEAAENVGGFVLEVARFGWAVFGSRDADVGHAVEDAVNARSRLDARERTAGAGVGSAPEG